MKAREAIRAIESQGILLVYPIDNRKEPPSLWSSFYPRSPMRWEWDQDGDDRVARLWHLREELSRSGAVVYAKWYQGRATFFSKPVFTALLALSSSQSDEASLSRDAKRIYDVLREDSPLSTKTLKAATDLRGKLFESTYERAMKELWSKLWIVGYGEVDEGAFPSLAIGATSSLFEDLWQEARTTDRATALKAVEEALPRGSLFLRYWMKRVSK